MYLKQGCSPRRRKNISIRPFSSSIRVEYVQTHQTDKDEKKRSFLLLLPRRRRRRRHYHRRRRHTTPPPSTPVICVAAVAAAVAVAAWKEEEEDGGLETEAREREGGWQHPKKCAQF